MSSENKHWATWVLDVVVGIGALAQIIIGVILIYQLRAYEESNELTRQSLELNKKNMELTAKSLDAAQEGIKSAQQANEIAQKNLLATTTPSMDVRITDIRHKAQSIEIHYDISNHSNSPARTVTAFCNLWHIKGYLDASLLNGFVSIMPNQSLGYTSQLMFLNEDVAKIFDSIEAGRVQITIVVVYSDVAGSRNAFSETFWKENGTFVVGDSSYNIPREELDKLMKNAEPTEK